MKILSSAQIKELDQYTIANEPISSLDLMERAASRFTDAVSPLIVKDRRIYVFCGMGNNGGDGLAVARMLVQRGYSTVQVFIVKHSLTGSSDFLANETRLKDILQVNYIEADNQIPHIESDSTCIDAIFGSGLSRPAEGIASNVIKAINESRCTVYAIDLPSGLYCDKTNEPKDTVTHSTVTFTFHAPKLTFLFAQNEKYVGDFRILDIGLSKEFNASLDTQFEYVDEEFMKGVMRRRPKFSNKGTFGHAVISAGSYGKIGAAVLAVSAALKSGAGLVSTHIPGCGYQIMQITNPAAMVLPDKDEKMLSQILDYSKFSAAGVGPGIGTDPRLFAFMEALLKTCPIPLVLDADALNIISDNYSLRYLLKPNLVLTPHPGEFKRLTGVWKDDLDKIQKQIQMAKHHKVYVVLKGANTSIATPEGKIYFNSTGNPGMAKGGSGDVLTGVITTLLAQGYKPDKAVLLGVYAHGLAGDEAASQIGQTGMNAEDIINYLPKAFASLEKN